MCIVGKSWDYHVLEALSTTLDEGVAMVADSVAFLHADGRDVFYDAEHFFDGYRRNPGVLACGCSRARRRRARPGWCSATPTAARSPTTVERIVARGRRPTSAATSASRVHLHDDAGTGVANALAGVRGGAIQVQGTINGYGERTGNCNLTTIIPNLTLKMGIETIPADRLERLTPVAHHVAELVNMALNPQAAYVGSSAFAHKAGLHVSAIAKRPDAYEHVPPDSVGNGTRFVVSELAGKSTLTLKAKELGLTLDGPQLNDLVDTLKRMEHDGYHFEVADASLELLMRRARGWEQAWFEVESFRVITDDDDPFVGAGRRHHRGHHQGARRRASASSPPPRATARSTRSTPRCAPRSATATRRSRTVHLTDYKVRVLDTAKGTGAVTRVLVDSTNGERTWTTIGVSENIIEASWQALYDSLVYGLLLACRRDRAAVALHHAHRPVRRPRARRPPAPGAQPGAGRAPAGRRRAGAPTGPAISSPGQPTGTLLGRPGPERRVRASPSPGGSATRSRSAPHEHADDALAVIAELAMKRAASFGRAPMMADVEIASSLLGYQGDVDAAFAQWRTGAVHGADHEYGVRRAHRRRGARRGAADAAAGAGAARRVPRRAAARRRARLSSEASHAPRGAARATGHVPALRRARGRAAAAETDERRGVPVEELRGVPRLGVVTARVSRRSTEVRAPTRSRTRCWSRRWRGCAARRRCS